MIESANLTSTPPASPGLFRRMCRQLRYVVWHSDLLFTKFILAISSIIMGIRFLTDDDASKRYVYTLALHVAPAEAWAVGFLAVGILSTFAILTKNHSLNIVLPVRVVGCFLWSALALMLYMSGAVGAAMVPLLMLAAASWLVLARTSERK